MEIRQQVDRQDANTADYLFYVIFDSWNEPYLIIKPGAVLAYTISKKSAH